ncbi:hypothetical protein B0H14DRAFT_3876895 [Mycena olivaceomarginata]|nr:hypothetical protein B0H14DRAFT_3876895 [Mycena olivaceomarginata]
MSFMANRYMTEGLAVYVVYVLSGGTYSDEEQSCRTFIWILAIFATVCTSTSHFVVMARLHSLWEHRKAVKWTLLGVGAASLVTSMVFIVIVADGVKVASHAMCAFLEKPWSLPYALGALTFLDLFVITMSVVNVLDQPYTWQAEVMKKLRRDGVIMFLFLFALRVINLVMSIAGEATYCFVTVTVVWSMCSIVTSRIQLRVEALRFIRFTGTEDMWFD